MREWTVMWVASLLVLLVFNGAFLQPMLADIGQTGGNLTNDTGALTPTGEACIAGGGLASLIPSAILAVPPFYLIALVLGIAGGVQCIPTFNFLGASGAVLGLVTSLTVLGGVVLVGGFLTSGASRGGISTIGYALVIGGATAVGITLVSPLFTAIPHIGLPALVLYSAFGVILVFHEGMDLLGGG